MSGHWKAKTLRNKQVKLKIYMKNKTFPVKCDKFLNILNQTHIVHINDFIRKKEDNIVSYI